jgi:predicted transposase YbfD/YdcC
MVEVCHIKKMTTAGPDLSKDFFKEHFSTLKEPRRTSKGNLIYSLEEILFLTISAVISGCSTWVAIEAFGKLKIDWLRKFYSYKNGTPSHDAISDLFSIIDPKIFGECFMNWVKAIADITDSEVVSFDGKTIRGVGSNSRKYPIHIVTAFCTKNRISLGQESVEDKSNEIIAIPKLLDLLTLTGCIITTDAMGCQKKIAEKIREKKADYILQVKDNQKELKQQIEKLFDIKKAKSSDTEIDFGHGRIETRTCEVITDLKFMDGKEDWAGLSSVVRIESIRETKKTGVKTKEFRYYITSIKDNAKLINNSVRKHWGIENHLHWNLDVIFNEDGQLKRKGDSAKNFNIISKVALGLIENEKTVNISKPLKRLHAALDDTYREKILKV